MPQPASADFRFPIRVYYANYLKFFERARTEWLRALGVEQRALADETGCIFVVRGIDTQYRRPAALDDSLTIRSQVSRLGKASIDFLQFCERGDELLATGKVQVGCVDRATLRPRALPSGLVRTLAPLAAGPATD